MAYMLRLMRREGETEAHPIGLGWLLAIVIGGGVLLFTTIGLLLVWWVKKRRQEGGSATVYGFAAAPETSMVPASSTRLMKRRLLGSESASRLSSRFSSRLSLSRPPTLPPLPTYHSFGLLDSNNNNERRGRKRSRSWVDEDEIHGPKMGAGGSHRRRRSARETWFGRDSWFGRVPTLPDLSGSGGGAEKIVVNGQRQLEQYDLEVQPQYQHQLLGSQTEPAFPTLSAASSPDELLLGTAGTGMTKPPQTALMRPSGTESDLKVILHSTDQRLRERGSRSPVKTPRSSPTKGTPKKTPHSHRTGSSHGSGRGWRVTPSPSKRAGLNMGTPRTGSRDPSMSSIGSAANSLIAAATQELELPGGLSSPSKARGVRWDQQQVENTSPTRYQQRSPQRQSPQSGSPQRRSPQRQSPQRQNFPQHQQEPLVLMPRPQPPQMQLPQMQYPQGDFPQMHHHLSMPNLPAPEIPLRNPERRMSHESDESSSLSTLYSINEPEEKKPTPVASEEDPFVEKGYPRRRPSWQTRQRPNNFDSLRRAKTLSSASLTRYVIDESAIPPPLRPASTVSHTGGARERIVSSMAPGSLVRLNGEESAEDTSSQNTELMKTPSLYGAHSEASFVTMSVDSDATEVPVNDTANGWIHRANSLPGSPTTPNMKGVDIFSSPYDEHEIMSILMSTAAPQRTLPIPPTSVIGPDGNVITALSPSTRNGTVYTHRRVSSSSSIYTMESMIGDPGAAFSGSPSRQSTVRSVNGPPISNLISDLRRMNSMVSSYSVTSVTSTMIADGDSPTIPASLGGGGGMTKSRSMILNPTATISSRNYLNIGNGRPISGRSSHIANQQRRTSGNRRVRSGTLLNPDFQNYGKENQGLGLRLSRLTDGSVSSGLREGSHGANLSREPVMDTVDVSVPPGGTKQKPASGPVDELMAEERRENEQRDSVQSLGLYDQDGFLLSSPEREARKRGLRI